MAVIMERKYVSVREQSGMGSGLLFVCAEASQERFETLTGVLAHSMALYEMIFETVTDLIAVLTMGLKSGRGRDGHANAMATCNARESER